MSSAVPVCFAMDADDQLGPHPVDSHLQFACQILIQFEKLYCISIYSI